MKTTLIMIRHGQSITNLTKVFTGQLDTELTELGKLQADLAAKALRNVHIDKMYSSDLRRTVDPWQERTAAGQTCRLLSRL